MFMKMEIDLLKSCKPISIVINMDITEVLFHEEHLVNDTSICVHMSTYVQ
jgi:hypothetical protein